MQEGTQAPTIHSHNSFRGDRLAALKKTPSLPVTPLSDGAMVQFDPTTRYVTPGASGGSFSARTQIVSVTLPSLHNDYYIPSRGLRKRPVAISNRFLPTEDETIPECPHSPRDRLRVEQHMLQLAKERSRRAMQIVPHRSEQPYLMAGFPVKLQQRHQALVELSPRAAKSLLATPGPVLQPQPSLVQDIGGGERRESLQMQSGISEMFLTQSTLEPIVMNDITVRKLTNYRSPCTTLLGADLITEFGGQFRRVAGEGAESVGYGAAEALVRDSADPAHAARVLDLTGSGRLEAVGYVVGMGLFLHWYKTTEMDFLKLEAKLKTMKARYESLTSGTLADVIRSFSKLLVTDPLLENIASLISCNPDGVLSFPEYLAVFKFWEEMETALLELNHTSESDIVDYVNGFVNSGSSASFGDIFSSSEMLLS